MSNTQPEISKSTIFNATKWSVLAEVMAKLAAPIVNMILARVLTPSAFGIVASITIVTSFADIFTDAGFQRYLIQHEFANEDELEKSSNVAFYANLALSVFLYLLIVIFRAPIAAAVGCASEATGIAVAGLAVICTTFSGTMTAQFRRNLNFKPLFFVRMISAFIPLVITVPLAFILKNYWALILGTLAQQVFNAVLLTILSPWKPRLFFRFSLLKQMVSFSLWNLLESLSVWFAGQVNIFIVSNALSSYYLGLYKTSMTTINSYMSLATASVTPVLFSALSRYQHEKSKYQHTFYAFLRGLSLLVFPMGFGVFLYRDFAVQLLLGSQWTEAAEFLGLWALSSAIIIVYTNTACEVYRSLGKPKILFFIQCSYLLVYIPAILWGVEQGFSVLCYVSCLVRFIPLLINLFVLKYKFDFSVFSIFKSTGIPLFASLLMSGVALLLQRFSQSPLWNCLSILLCAIIYCSILFVFPSTRNSLFSLPGINRLYKKLTKR